MSLDSVLIRFQQGASQDKIVQSFPALKLSQVYGVIGYYLENEKAITSPKASASLNALRFR